MKNSFGTSVIITLFGESHGPAVGAVLDGMAPGIPVDEGYIAERLRLRRPCGSISTARIEKDDFSILSGVFNGRTSGTPICIVIPNEDARSGDYERDRALARPGHADHTAFEKYHGFEDHRGGGHFSGRVTAALAAAGAIALGALRERGIRVGTHIARCGGVDDRPFSDLNADIAALEQMSFAALDPEAGERMRRAISDAAEDGDSVGGILETAVTGLPAGVGEPWFDTLEGLLAHMLFSVPGIKGVQFGGGFDLADARGSEYNDELFSDGGTVRTRTNNSGGVNGGISNGMPVMFRCAVKPTPSIFKTQATVDLFKGENALLALKGRHDPAIIHRVRAVVDSAAALALCDALALRYGTDWLGGVGCAAH
ncbi:MAG: chorismate synthase [Oscillospiraceae bacterium]|nr:chorismate synthase [Oscillospiraceae bacterium]